MKCSYCTDPIYKFQKFEQIPDRTGKEVYYHSGCYEIMLDNITDKIKKSNEAIAE